MTEMGASHTLDDHPKLRETEFALDISPCPRFEGAEASKDIGKSTKSVRKRSGLDRRRQAQSARQTVFDDDDLTETLTVGWAIVLAIAVAVVISISGG